MPAAKPAADARYNKHRGTGYLVQIMETFAEDDSTEQKVSEPRKPYLITHVAVDQLTMHDKDALEPAFDDTDQRGVKPKELFADSHYGSNECLEKGRERDVDIVSPSMPAKGTRQGKLTLEDFELDELGLVIRCPRGQSPVAASLAEIRLQVLFDPVACASCPRQGDCPAAAGGRSQFTGPGIYPFAAQRDGKNTYINRSLMRQFDTTCETHLRAYNGKNSSGRR